MVIESKFYISNIFFLRKLSNIYVTMDDAFWKFFNGKSVEEYNYFITYNNKKYVLEYLRQGIGGRKGYFEFSVKDEFNEIEEEIIQNIDKVFLLLIEKR